MIRTTLVLVAVCALAALTAAGTADAASPTLLTAGSSGGYATATWSLADGAQVWTVEVATSSAVDTDGAFLADNVVDIKVFMDTSTSWTGSVSLDPGTYYLHVSGSSCDSCGDVSWSAVKSFSVGGSATTTGSTTTTTTSSGGTTTTSSTTTSRTTTTGQTTTVTAPTTTTTGTTPAPPPVPAIPPYNARRPAIAVVSLGRAARAVRSLEGTVRVCDRSPGRLVVRSLARSGSTTVASHAHLAAAAPGCWPYLLRVGLPSGSGHVTVTLRVRDGAGMWSSAISRRVR